MANINSKKLPKKFKLALNSLESLEILLQELYDEASKNIMEIQKEINRLSQSTTLNEEVMDSKVKYAKAMNDYSANKLKAIGAKTDIAKLMLEVIKYQGNTKKMAEESEELPENWGDMMSMMDDEPQGQSNEANKTKVYKI